MSLGEKVRERWAAVWAALAVVLAGGVWLLVRLSANGPGDSGPVVGPGAAEKVRYGLVAGVIVVLVAVAVGGVVFLVGHRLRRR